MHVLLDENIPHRLIHYFRESDTVRTVSGCGWIGKKNGELLSLGAKDFDVLVTMDQGLEYQQNLSHVDLGIIILSAPTNRLEDLLPLMPEVNRLLEQIVPGQICLVRTPD